MQHYIAIKRRPLEPGLSLGLLDEPVRDWQRKARHLRIRRERLLKQRLHESGTKQ